jgi:hypothetical protein
LVLGGHFIGGLRSYPAKKALLIDRGPRFRLQIRRQPLQSAGRFHSIRSVRKFLLGYKQIYTFRGLASPRDSR